MHIYMLLFTCIYITGFNEEFFSCDGAFWREKVVSNCIGLLYECSLREGRFLELIMSSPPLTIVRSEDGRTAALPVMIQVFTCISMNDMYLFKTFYKDLHIYV